MDICLDGFEEILVLCGSFFLGVGESFGEGFGVFGCGGDDAEGGGDVGVWLGGCCFGFFVGAFWGVVGVLGLVWRCPFGGFCWFWSCDRGGCFSARGVWGFG